MLTQTRELTQAEKAAAWDRHVALVAKRDANEREIENGIAKRYDLQRLIDQNYKEAQAQTGQTVEPCPACNFEVCNCEPRR